MLPGILEFRNRRLIVRLRSPPNSARPLKLWVDAIRADAALGSNPVRGIVSRPIALADSELTATDSD